ncbi:GTP-binding protein [Myroides sp. M-43]|uniref:sulfate adenylyltransferase subunit 1 n=1 Tax=Myroides oncorhynchi TaxID=2893756 RepID=UPI001E5CD135|nr:GTP-binding protein [Myroides oncorhynchi]MCC9043827.1 GTP-binding protein [Myroides oncorhynchi]
MQTLKFITAGNVDDGKSTLIGRLLYDSNSISTDHLGVLASKSEIGEDTIDLALITDGLRAEREQGITIDVAYKYFSTASRKFIIADSPGHQQYTKNMITAASVSDLIIILIDIRKGITEQTKRHASIASLMGIKKVIVAVNKIDLVQYSQEQYELVKTEFDILKQQLDFTEVLYIPISALEGDNIVNHSILTPWYKGKTLLGILETIQIETQLRNVSRFQVQLIIRPQTKEYLDYRGYAGLVLSGQYKVGDRVRVLPSDISATIIKLEKNLQEVNQVVTGDNIVMHFDSDIDISRGDTIYLEDQKSPEISNKLTSWISWLDTEDLHLGKTYILKHRFHSVRVKIKSIDRKWDINKLEFHQGDKVSLNDIAQVSLQTSQSLNYDPFIENSKTGNAILVDETSYNTVGALMFL